MKSFIPRLSARNICYARNRRPRMARLNFIRPPRKNISSKRISIVALRNRSPGPKQVSVRLYVETSDVKQDFDRWLGEIGRGILGRRRPMSHRHP